MIFDHTGFADWIESRPRVVQGLASRYPVTSAFRETGGAYWYVVGWDEDGNVLISRICPFADYETALATKVAVHPECLDACEREDMSEWTAPK